MAEGSIENRGTHKNDVLLVSFDLVPRSSVQACQTEVQASVARHIHIWQIKRMERPIQCSNVTSKNVLYVAVFYF